MMFVWAPYTYDYVRLLIQSKGVTFLVTATHGRIDNIGPEPFIRIQIIAKREGAGVAI